MEVTDFLTKQNAEYYKDRPIYKDKINTFRNKMLPLYHKSLSKDFDDILEANGELNEIYYFQGYRESKPTD